MDSDASLRLPADHPVIAKSLRRLSREALTELAAYWTRPEHQDLSAPALDSFAAEARSLNGPAQSLEDLSEVYVQLLADKASKKEILERMQDIDWKNGLSLWQLSQADTRDLIDRPLSNRWTAFKLSVVNVAHEDRFQKYKPGETIRPFELNGKLFAEGLKKEIGGIFKLHFHQSRLPSLGMNIVRVYALNGAYHLDDKLITAADGGQVSIGSCWLAFRDIGTEVYISPPVTGQESNQSDLKSIVVDSIPRIVSTAEDRVLLLPYAGPPGPLPENDGSVRKSLATNASQSFKWEKEPNPF